MSGTPWTPEELEAATRVLQKHPSVGAAIRDPAFPRQVGCASAVTRAFGRAGLANPVSFLANERRTEVGKTTWGKGTGAEKRQEYNRSMGRTADLLGDLARGVKPDTPAAVDVSAYISQLAEEERRFINRRRARSASLGLAREALFIRQFKEACQHLPMQVQASGYAEKKTNHTRKRTVNLLLSDLHFGARLDPAELPVGYNAHQEARRFARVVAETRDYKLQYRDQTHLNILVDGDIIEGFLLHDLRDGDPLTDQFAAALAYFAQAITTLAAVYPTVHIVWQSGNHGRNKLRHPGRATSSKWDSFETMIGIAVQRACKPLANVTWSISQRPYDIVQLYDSQLFVTHGDTEINLGSPGKNLALDKISSQLDAINSSGEYGGPFAVFACGHVHVGLRVTFPSCTLMINPALVPPNGFARTVGYHAQACGQWVWESIEGFPVGDERLIKVGQREDEDPKLEEIITPVRFSGEGLSSA